mmetsp:Transcript_36958/g.118527  ORF Transcript_36958/g.118527 Transcript_36958/m.118527 type:complete len:305 (+) Transcript_36958:1387-2301(+)
MDACPRPHRAADAHAVLGPAARPLAAAAARERRRGGHVDAAQDVLLQPGAGAARVVRGGVSLRDRQAHPQRWLLHAARAARPLRAGAGHLLGKLPRARAPLLRPGARHPAGPSPLGRGGRQAVRGARQGAERKGALRAAAALLPEHLRARADGPLRRLPLRHHRAAHHARDDRVAVRRLARLVLQRAARLPARPRRRLRLWRRVLAGGDAARDLRAAHGAAGARRDPRAQLVLVQRNRPLRAHDRHDGARLAPPAALQPARLGAAARAVHQGGRIHGRRHVAWRAGLPARLDPCRGVSRVPHLL